VKVIVDDKIPFIQGVIEEVADEVIYCKGTDFTPALVADADALIVRTRTRCNRALLEGSKVEFIATATIGFDHIDTKYLADHNITWRNAPGCNAASVAQYIRSCFTLLQRERGLNLRELTIGIVGVGHVGTEVLHVCEEFGLNILLCDPPLLQREPQTPLLNKYPFHTLEELKGACDILTFHTPMVREGLYPTYHLVDQNYLTGNDRLKVLINSSRGEVVDNIALLEALRRGTFPIAIIDTWENEPHIHPELLEKVYIGTPHIAGYSADGKANATRMAVTALCEYFRKPLPVFKEAPALPKELVPSPAPEENILQLYDPRRDSNLLKQKPQLFEELRGNYPLRREKWN
jgi:erythronate-4-phosphate dehydrogenase